MSKVFNEIYVYDEVKEFFGDDCFRMTDVRGGVIIPNTSDIARNISEVNDKGFFRYGKYILYLHEQNEKYIIGSFACI